MTLNHYPTDVVIAVDHLKSCEDFRRHWSIHATSELALETILDPQSLEAGLDQLFQGLLQYPWMPLPDGGLVHTAPLSDGVLVEFDDDGTLLRGLILTLATGNNAVIRTANDPLWDFVTGRLATMELPLSPCRVVAPGTQVGQLHRLMIPSSGVHVPPQGVPGWDCLQPWAHGLLQRRYEPGNLITARAQDAARGPERLAAKFRYLTYQARKTEFYAQYPPISPESITSLPVLTKRDVAQNTLPVGRGLLPKAGRPTDGTVLRSGGTDGTPRYVPYSRADWQNMIRESLAMYWELGIRPGDRVADILWGGGLYGGLITSFDELITLPVQVFAFGQQVTAKDLVAAIKSHDINVVLGQPALLMPLLREVNELDPTVTLEKVIYGGTGLSQTDRQWLYETMGVSTATSALAANDGLQLGYQCAHLSGSAMHHIDHEFNFIEIVDMDGGRVPNGQPGRIAVTSLQKTFAPLIRYDIGDVGLLTEIDCGCGVSGIGLEYLGRSDGTIKVGGITVEYREVRAFLDTFGVVELQVNIDTDQGLERLRLGVESDQELDIAEIRNRLADEFAVFALRSDTVRGVGAGLVEIIRYERGNLPRNPSSGKVTPVVDHRISSGRSR